MARFKAIPETTAKGMLVYAVVDTVTREWKHVYDCFFMGRTQSGRIDVEADNMRIYIQSSAAAYSETIPLEKDTGQNMTIGFNPALIRTTLESFPDENVQVLFLSPKAPMIITSEAHSLKGLLLPVVVR